MELRLGIIDTVSEFLLSLGEFAISPQFLNNQSDRSSIVKRGCQTSVAFLPVVTTS